MVVRGTESIFFQMLGDFLGLFAGKAIHDSRGIPLSLYIGKQLLFLVFPRSNAIVDVGPIKAVQKDPFTRQVQLVHDVFFRGFVRGCSEGQNGDVGQEFTQPIQLGVLGAEVVSPGADAMRFIDGNAVHALVFEPLQQLKVIGRDALG